MNEDILYLLRMKINMESLSEDDYKKVVLFIEQKLDLLSKKTISDRNISDYLLFLKDTKKAFQKNN